MQYACTSNTCNFLLDLGQHMTKIIYVHTIERPRVA